MTAQVYTHLRIWDGVADGYLDGADAIRVEGDRIAAIGLAAEIGAGAAARDMHGATALPGLIDAHVHMVLDPELRDPLSQTAADRSTRAAAMAQRAGHFFQNGRGVREVETGGTEKTYQPAHVMTVLPLSRTNTGTSRSRASRGPSA